VTAPRGTRALTARPTLLVVLGGLALYPFVREPAARRVLKLSEDQALRALHAERARSDAPETEASQRHALDRALEEEALAELAIADELHRNDDGLRHALAEAARARLGAGSEPPPTDDELHALLGEVPIEALVDAEIANAADGSVAQKTGLTLAAVEAALGVAHLPMPTRDAPVTAALAPDAGPRTLTLRVHPETERERLDRARPELERRFRARGAAAKERALLDALVQRYDRVERP
jgi:hypothetical protein